MRYYLPRPPADPFIDRLTRERASAWEQAIRTACETMDGAHGLELDAVSITLSGGAEGEVALLCGLAEELSMEYGLTASFRLGSGSFTARFTRPSREPVSGPRAT